MVYTTGTDTDWILWRSRGEQESLLCKSGFPLLVRQNLYGHCNDDSQPSLISDSTVALDSAALDDGAPRR